MSLEQVSACKTNEYTTVKVATSQDGMKVVYTENAYSNTKRAEVDGDGDGKADSASLFYKDDEGKTIKGVYDINADGYTDCIALFDYDDDGNLTTRYDDVDANGSFDYYTEFSYDEDGNRIASELQRVASQNNEHLREKSKAISHNATLMFHQKLEKENRNNANTRTQYQSPRYPQSIDMNKDEAKMQAELSEVGLDSRGWINKH